MQVYYPMRSVPIFCIVFVVLSQNIMFADEVHHDETFQEISLIARKLWRAIHDAPIIDRTHIEDKDAIAKLIECLQRVESTKPENIYHSEILAFLKLTVTSVSKQEVPDRASCFRKLNGMLTAIEQVQMASDQTYTCEKGSKFFPRKIGSKIIPISGWQEDSQHVALIQWTRIEFCPYTYGKPYNIGQMFQELGCYDIAWRAF